MNEIGIISQLGRTELEKHLPGNLIEPHFSVLNHLVRVQDGQTPNTMARAFQVPKTSIAHTLKVLEARGLVDIRANPEDGRSKCVWLTEKGRQLREDTIVKLIPSFGKIIQSFGIDRFEKMLPHLQALRILLDENRNAGDIKNGPEDS